MKKQTTRFMYLVRFLLALLITLGWSSVLFADAPVFQAPAANRMGVWEDTGSPGFSAGRVEHPTLAIDAGGTPYVAYRDTANSNKATVMKYDGNNWVVVGSVGFSAGQARDTSIAIDAGGIPYVAYEDVANSSKATVMKFNGSSWVTVGTAGFSPDNADEISIAIHNANNIYVLYEYSDPVSDDNKLVVMRFNGISWATVGVGDFTEGEAYDSSLAIDSSGTPYVAYVDIANDEKATVMKFNGSSWVTVGAAGFSADYINGYTDLAIDSVGTPYVVYMEGQESKATVMKFDGSSWVTVGSAGFSADTARAPSIAIDSNGHPYVAYGDYAEGERLTVMKFDGSAWTVVDRAGFTDSYMFDPCLAIDPADHAFVVYEDWGNSGKASVMQTIDGFQYEVAENTAAVGTLVATDPESDPVVYSISEGDSGYFYLDRVTGELRFVLAPDFEVPGDADGDNAYEFMVTASANGDDISTKVRIAVSNAPEGPAFQGQPVWEPVGPTGFSYKVSSSPFMALDGNDIPYIVYRASYQGQVAVQKYNGTSWDYVGPEFNYITGWGIASYSTETSMAFDSANTPYILYRDEHNSNRLTVKKYDGESWVAVGTEGFTAVSPNYKYLGPSIAIDSSDTPYVAYKDAANSFKATVMKFNGSSWVTVGSAGFSTGSIASTIDKTVALAMDNSDTPYVAYSDADNSYKATVMKFNGSTWDTVGSAGFSADWVRNTNIAIDGNDIVYVAYQDRSGTSYRTTVMRYNGNSWVSVGQRRFPSADTANVSLALDRNNIPYVAYTEKSPAGATVMKYNGSSWGVVGSARFSDGGVINNAIGVDSFGTPFVGIGDYVNGISVMKAVAGTMHYKILEGTEFVDGIYALDPENDPISYSISGGDSDYLSVDGTNGLLSFIMAPDFENPQDADGNNIYEFTVTISGGGIEMSGPTYVLVLDAPEYVVISAPVITGGQFGFTFTGATDLVLVVEACTNLVNPVWTAVSTNILTDGSSSFNDPELPNHPGRYYRVSVP